MLTHGIAKERGALARRGGLGRRLAAGALAWLLVLAPAPVNALAPAGELTAPGGDLAAPAGAPAAAGGQEAAASGMQAAPNGARAALDAVQAALARGNAGQPKAAQQGRRPAANRSFPTGLPFVSLDGQEAVAAAAEGPGQLSATPEWVRVIVEIKAEPLVSRLQRQGRSLVAAAPGELARMTLEVESQVDRVRLAAVKEGINLKTRRRFSRLLSGFSAEVRPADLERLQALPGVERVRIANRYLPATRYSVPLIGAEELWNQDPAVDGTGTVIAIVDTGIDYRHPDLGGQSELDPAGKVIGGYNFADANNDVITWGNDHGTHVAGIAAGTGAARVKGVAPGAQLLAQKVFSDDPDNPYAYADDLVAAIEDAIDPYSPHHPRGVVADAINMSLGATAGFVWPDDPEQRAIQRAVDAGTVVAVSAGNSGYTTSSYFYPLYQHQDIAVVGSPGLYTGTIQVASSNNVVVTIYGKTLVANGSASGPIHGATSDVYMDSTSQARPESLGAADYQLAQAANLGCDPADFAGQDFTGKVALVKRGSCYFQTKADNAAAAGAVAIVVWNHQPDPQILTMAMDAATIPGVMIMNSYGAALKAALDAGETVTVNFAGETVALELPDPTGDTISNFSSWGTTPDLQLKPDLTAPGGNIFSAVTGGEYASYSGTSMAAPHVAGAVALIKQAHPDWTPEQIKIALMNTARLLYPEEGYPFPASPRQQGAGRIQVDQAAATPVLAITDDGTGSAALGVVTPGPEALATFTVTLKNAGDQPVTYTVNPGTVLTPYAAEAWGYVWNYTPYLDQLPEASIQASTDSVTLAPYSQGQVTFQLDLSQVSLPDYAPYGLFAEGFVTFSPEGAGVPELHVPYVAYLGDWLALPVVDPGMEDPMSYLGLTGLYSPIPGMPGYYGALGWDVTGQSYDPMWNAISPNGDGLQDSLAPLLVLLRNGRQVELEVRDADEALVRQIGREEDMRNMGAVDYYLGYWFWDGTRYSGGDFEPVADGQYYVDVRSLPETGDAANPAHWQTYRIPVKVDTVVPTVAITSEAPRGQGGPYELTWAADDALSGIWGYALVLDGELVPVDEAGNVFLPAGATDFTLDLTPGPHEVAVVALDNGGNMAAAVQEIGAADALVVESDRYETNQESLTVGYQITDAVANVTAALDGGEPVDNGRNTAYTVTGLTEGEHVLLLRAYDAEGILLAEAAVRIVADMTPPALRVAAPQPRTFVRPEDPAGNGNPWVLFAGAVTDPHLAALTIDGTDITDWLPGAEGGDFSGYIEYPGANPAGQRVDFTMTATDRMGNQRSITRTFYLDGASPQVEVETAPSESGADDTVIITGTSVDFGPYDLIINGDMVYREGREPEGITPHNWSYEVRDLEPGENVVVIQAEDLAGNRTERQLTIHRSLASSLSPDRFSPAQGDQTSLTVGVDPAGASGRILVRHQGEVIATLHEGALTEEAYVWDGRQADGTPFPDGLYSVEVSALGYTRSHDVALDSTGPAAPAADLPEGGALLPERQVALAGTAPGAARVTVAWEHLQEGSSGSAIAPVVEGRFELELVLPADGEYRLTLTAVDDLGNPSETAGYTLAVDSTPPAVPALVSPAPGGVVRENPFTVSGSAPDADRVQIELYRGEERLAGQVADLDGSGHFAVALEAPDGAYALAVTALDQLGRTSETTVSFIVDAMLPAVPVIEAGPVPGATLEQPRFDLSGTAAGAETVLLQVQAGNETVLSSQVPVSAGRFATAVELPGSGEYRLILTAADGQGNWSEPAVVPFRVGAADSGPGEPKPTPRPEPRPGEPDPVPAQVTIDQQPEGPVVSSRRFTLAGTYQGGQLQVTVNGEPLPAGRLFRSRNRYQALIEVPADGTYTVRVEVRGNGQAVAETTIRVDDTPPQIISLKASGPYILGYYLVTGVLEDTSGIESLQVYGHEAPVVKQGDQYRFHAFLRLRTGENRLSMLTRDGAGNVGIHRNLTLEIPDRKPPVLTLHLPDGERVATRSRTFYLSGRLSEEATLTVWLGDEQVFQETIRWHFNLRLSRPEGADTALPLRIEAVDSQGNKAEPLVRTLVFDRSRPEVTVTRVEAVPGEPGVYQVSGVWSDYAGLAAGGVRLGPQVAQVETDAADPTRGTFSVQLALQPGGNFVRLYAQDRAGNSLYQWLTLEAP